MSDDVPYWHDRALIAEGKLGKAYCLHIFWADSDGRLKSAIYQLKRLTSSYSYYWDQFGIMVSSIRKVEKAYHGSEVQPDLWIIKTNDPQLWGKIHRVEESCPKGWLENVVIET